MVWRGQITLLVVSLMQNPPFSLYSQSEITWPSSSALYRPSPN